MGSEVAGYQTEDENGKVISTPKFRQVLKYDLKIREEVADLMNDGLSFIAALQSAQENNALKNSGFLTPMMGTTLADSLARIEAEAKSRAPPTYNKRQQ